MKLHENPELFKSAILAAAQPIEDGGLGIRPLFIEKDYWITRSLAQLACSPYRDHMVFKGGTSLSKAYELTHRFSEDIDVAVINADQYSQGQLKRLIHHSAHSMSEGMNEEQGSTITRKTSAYYKQLYTYPSLIESFENLPIREGQILLEINSFANPYPFVLVEIQSLLAEFLQNKEASRYIIDEYQLQPFTINVLDKRRTMLEKIVSLLRFSFAEDSEKLASKIRHFYDLYFLMQDAECREYLQSEQFRSEFKELYAHDQESFDLPKGWNRQPHAASPLLMDFDAVWKQLRGTYETKIPPLTYVQPIPSADAAAEAFRMIAEELKKI
ncbi:MAG: nucleotidyl transferase AbiEii/AbiGii toxin family protein [Paludibacteraceae bacterium]|nr:nucleotidyl transferase AbiEii/AbiGii toxin family protein [Paludibacteraceae bacterium]